MIVEFQNDVAEIKAAGLFDEEWYLRQYPDVKLLGEDPVAHYLMVGARLMRNPSPDFDTRAYIDQHPEAGAPASNPLLHYIRGKRTRNGIALTDLSHAGPFVDASAKTAMTLLARIEELETALSDSIRIAHSAQAIQTNLISRNAEVRTLKQRLSEVKTSQDDLKVCALEMFATSTSLFADELAVEIETLAISGLVDAGWYLETYTDVRDVSMDPVEHYFHYGAKEGRNPNAYFDTGWYLVKNPVLIGSGRNPAVHYHAEGWKAGRDPSPRFGTKAYLAVFVELWEQEQNPLAHYLNQLRSKPELAGRFEPEPEPAPSDVQAVSIKAPSGAREFEPVGPFVLHQECVGANNFAGIDRFNGLSPERVARQDAEGETDLRLIALSEALSFFDFTPRIAFPKRSLVRFRIDLRTLEKGSLSLSYVTKSDKQYDDQKRISRCLVEGVNSVEFILGADHLSGPIRFSFRIAGPVWISAFRVDTAPRPALGGPVMSFVIPCFNHGEFVDEAYRSITEVAPADQVEVIVVDDGSTDVGCRAALDRISLAGAKLIRQKNQGLGAARNNGIRVAQGRYVLPVDADNTIRPAYFLRSIEMFETDPTIGVVYGDLQYFGARSGRNTLKDHNIQDQFVQNYIDACAAFRREVWEQVGGYQQQMIGYQDWEFWAAVDSLNFWKFYHFRDIGFDYRVQAGSMVTHTVKFHEDILDFISARHVRNLRKSHADFVNQLKGTKSRSKELSAPIVLSAVNSKPLVSIIAPNYNKAPYLRTRLDSIFKQTYKNYEVIILDNASTDNSRIIIDNYASRYKNVKLIYNEKNNGNVFLQWQKGIDAASGEIIWIAECDDYCDFSFLEKVVPPLAGPFNIGISYCQSNFVDQDGKIFGNHIESLRNLDQALWNYDFVMEGREFLRRFLRRMNCLPNASGIVFRRELIDLIDWKDVTTFAVCGDWWVWSSFLQKVNIHFTAESLNYFRFDTTTSRSKAQRDLSRVREHFKIFSMINNRIDLTEDERSDSLQRFGVGLQRHLDDYGADETELLALLADMHKVGGKHVGVRLPIFGSNSQIGV